MPVLKQDLIPTVRPAQAVSTFIYTGIHVSDLKRAIRFYTEELGMKLLFSSKIKETGGKVAWLKSKGSSQILELNWYPVDYEHGGTAGLDHLAFQLKDVDKTYKRFTKKYEGAIAPFDEGRWRLAYVKDPDGNWIELGEKYKKKNSKRSSQKQKVTQ